MTAPCSWPIDTTCLPTDADPAAAREAAATAVGVLWALTGRQFGPCPMEARPCPPGTTTDAVPLAPGPGWEPALQAGRIINTPTCTRAVCDRTGAVLLPGPVAKVLRFVVDGEDIDLSSITVEGARVWRADGSAWPDQNLHLASGEPGTWSIHYLRGFDPPPGAAHAAGALAREFYAACHGGRCQLPRRTQQVQRQGITVTMVDPADIYASGATGLTEVDLWIRAHNPNRLQEPSVAWSPDVAVW